MKKTVPFPLALASIVCTIVIMILCLAVLHTGPQLPLLIGCAIAAGFALWGGCSFRQIGSGVIRSVRQSLQAICILLLIGALIGVWIAAGVVPAMVYYGLQLISPRLFLPGAMLVCAVLSMFLGSWGTAGTVGLAFMGMAHAMGIPLPLTAGAVISGSYVGDKLSPLADTTNLAAAVAQVDIFTAIRHIFKVSAPVFLICLGVYGAVGWHYGGTTTDSQQLTDICQTLSHAFHLSLLNLLPLLILLVCMLVRIPAIPSLAAGIVSGIIYGAVSQNTSVWALVRCTVTGFISQTHTDVVDELLSAGGILSMLYTISIILLAMSFGGIMEHTGQMEVLMRPLMKRTKGYASLMSATVATCICTNVMLPDQYIAIALPGQMYAGAFDTQDIPRKELALCIGTGGALTSALVPWNTCGTFMAGILGVGTLSYLPFTFYNILMPIAVALYAVFRQKKTKQ